MLDRHQGFFDNEYAENEDIANKDDENGDIEKQRN